jgi:hypothetical protein
MKAKVNQYLSTKNIRRRRRVDELMIMIAIVGIAGSVLVFNSYASRKIETQNPGSYSFIRLLAQSGSNYTNIAKVKSADQQDIYYMKKSSSLSTPFTLPASETCIYGWSRLGSNIEVGFSNVPTKIPPSLNNMTTDYPLINGSSRPLKCFNTAEYSNTKGDLVISSNGDIWLDKVVTK